MGNEIVKTIDVLDKGYVRILDVLGSDLTVVNSARVSYDKRVETLEKRDEGLLDFLAREGHTSPYRHTSIQFEAYVPLMIARQWFKYIVGGNTQQDAWNESSRRYVTENEEFYVPGPNDWRSAPENSKQGSGPNFEFESGIQFTDELEKHIAESVARYDDAMAAGVAPEQARLFLPAYGMYVRFYWTASLQSVAHLIAQRTADDSQKEFQDYAQAVKSLTMDHFPIALTKLLRYT